MKAVVSKTTRRVTVSGVRIPPSPLGITETGTEGVSKEPGVGRGDSQGVRGSDEASAERFGLTFPI